MIPYDFLSLQILFLLPKMPFLLNMPLSLSSDNVLPLRRAPLNSPHRHCFLTLLVLISSHDIKITTKLWNKHHQDHFVGPTKRPQAWHKWQLTLAYTGPLPRGSRTNTPGGWLQTTPEYHPTSYTNDPSEGRNRLA